MRHTIQAVIRPGEQSGYVAECAELSAVTQGATLDEVATISGRWSNSRLRVKTSRTTALRLGL